MEALVITSDDLAEIPFASEAFDDLPVASTTNPDKIFNSNDYELYENVPVFIEHTRTLKSGRTLTFGRKELESVVARSNQRIDETGDFAPVVIGHTSDDPDAPKPPKIGWAGPFRLGWLSDKRDKLAILADFRIDKDKVGLLKEYPRRSAELWAEDDYADMYLDPISLLGADTPWGDMGVLYAKQNGGVEKICYSIAPQAPGAYNVGGLPKPVSGCKDKCKERYAMSDYDALSGDQRQIAQTIVKAIFDSPEFNYIRRQMKRDADDVADEGLDEDQLGQGEPGFGGTQEDETEGRVDVAPQAERVPEEDDDKARYDAAEMGAEQVDYAEPTDEAEDDFDEDEPVDESIDEPDDAEGGTDLLDDSNEEPTDDYGEYDDSDDVYDPNEDEDITPVYDDDNYEGDDVDGVDDDDLYGTDNDGETVMKLREKVAELEMKIQRLEKAFDYTTDKVVSRERYSRLRALRGSYVFDERQERERCKYNKMTDSQFDARCREIQTNYRRVPTEIDVPGRLVSGAPAQFAERPGAIQYSKERASELERAVAKRAEENAQRGVYQPSEQIRAELAKQFD